MGYLDLGRHVLVSPNNRGGIPSFFISPKRIQSGGSYNFDFLYKSFGKRRDGLTEVFKWYAEHIYSSNPISRDYVRRPLDLPHRNLHRGNVAGMVWMSLVLSQEKLDAYEVSRDYLNRPPGNE